ncbi:DUF1801 domain-containing protein [Actinokineospora terrae]|uniref:YdhG-like domain-containing protein n=1 Tax=Actinokineospora terrae TaxID=155974 RepID=A0A1H9XNI3_9PSEU|nr:DUF1801 domain-containing protein [Actinokineospora terrae]SES47407.1 protein of unknown function (DU1801) [Actinokineospora terrae]
MIVAQEYADRHTPAEAAAVLALHEAVTAAGPDLEVAVKYGLLMYTVDGGWKHWVAGINITRKGACLRFLWGVLLDDPLGVLRAGTSTLMTWDIPIGTEIDAAQVGAYVREAIAKRDHFKANSDDIAAVAKAVNAAKQRLR